MKITFVVSPDKDWQALYIDGVCVGQAQSLDMHHLLHIPGIDGQFIVASLPEEEEGQDIEFPLLLSDLTGVIFDE